MSKLWASARRHLSPYGCLQRIETSTAPGVPDVAYCLLGASGWLELKEVASWPKKPETPLRLNSLTLDQVLWMERWERAGGSAHVLLQAGRDVLLLSPLFARRIYENRATRPALEAAALARGEGTFPTAALLRALSRRANASGSAGAARAGQSTTSSARPASRAGSA